MNKSLRRYFITIAVIAGMFIFPQSVRAEAESSFIENGELKVENVQKFLYEQELKQNNAADDEWITSYPLQDGLTIEVTKYGDMVVKSQVLQNLVYEYGDINLPVGKENCPSIQTQYGTKIIQGNELVTYWYGQPIEELKLSREIQNTEALLKMTEDKYVVMAEGNVYLIDETGKVYVLRNEGDACVIALTAYVTDGVEISIITEDGKWYYMAQSYESASWTLGGEDVICFSEEGPLKSLVNIQ